MNRFLAGAMVAAVAMSVPATAAASGKHGSKHRTKVLRASVKPTRADVADYSGMSGKAQLVSNRRNAKVSLHLRGMVPRTEYRWAIVKGTSAQTVCATGTKEPGFRYRRLRSNRAGRANSTAFAKRRAFTFDRRATYAVVVYQAGTTNEVLLCGVFKGKSAKPKPKPRPKPHGHGHGKGDQGQGGKRDR
jgi:hypothetical protein